jgi:hypothetical protein
LKQGHLVAATKNNTLPMFPAALEGSHSQSAKTDPEDSLRRQLDSRATDPSLASPGPSGPEAENLESILQNMAPARIWSPNAAVGAQSNGADFAAYRAEPRAAAKARDEKPSDARVVLDVTSPDLASLVEQAQARSEQAAGDDRSVPTVNVHRGQSARTAGRKQKAAVFALALGLVCAVGLFVAWKAKDRSEDALRTPLSDSALKAPELTSAVSALPPATLSVSDLPPAPLAAHAASGNPPDSLRSAGPLQTDRTAGGGTSRPSASGPSSRPSSSTTPPRPEASARPALLPEAPPRSEHGSGKIDTNGWRL